jgi:hypothetical protein
VKHKQEMDKFKYRQKKRKRMSLSNCSINYPTLRFQAVDQKLYYLLEYEDRVIKQLCLTDRLSKASSGSDIQERKLKMKLQVSIHTNFLPRK